MKKKKVLEVVEAFGGGVFTVINDLVNGLNDEYEVTIAYSLRNQTPQNFEKKFKGNVKFVKIENFTREINPKKDLQALKELKQLIKKEKPDIVHLHSSKAGVIGRLATMNGKYKMFYNPHGFSFLKQDDSKFKRSCYKVIEKIMTLLNPKCTIIGCSEGEYEEALKLSKNSICINNGINIDELKEKNKNFEEHKTDLNNLKICTIGRIGYQKNPKLFNEIAKSFPNIEFTWIGDGELKTELNSKNIITTGWKDRNEVLKDLNNKDVFILTSLWERFTNFIA